MEIRPVTNTSHRGGHLRQTPQNFSGFLTHSPTGAHAEGWLCFVLCWSCTQSLVSLHYTPRPCYTIFCLRVTQMHSQELYTSQDIHPRVLESLSTEGSLSGVGHWVRWGPRAPFLLGELIALFRRQQAPSSLLLLEFKH